MQQIDETIVEDFQVKKAMLDHLKIYINPEMYKKENDIKDPYERVNREFAQHSRTAKLYGKPRLSETMQNAVDEAERIKHAPEGSIVRVNLDDTI